MAQPVCSSDGTWCTIVENITHNATLAKAADWLIAKPLAIIVLLIVAFLVRWVLHRLITRLAQRAAEGPVPSVLAHGAVQRVISELDGYSAERRRQRAETMASLLKSIVTTVIVTIVIFMIIAQLGYNIGPLLASAGIVGVALGFGAQSLVKDFLSGIFLILEDQYGVGDSVNVGAASGTIEAVGLRVTRLRDVNGVTWFVRNGEILAVGNSSRVWSRVVLDVPVAYSSDLDAVRNLLAEVADELYQDPDFSILEQPEVWGVERWDPDGIVLRIAVKTTPAQSGPVARELRERIKKRFDEDGVEIPLPQRVVWQRRP